MLDGLIELHYRLARRQARVDAVPFGAGDEEEDHRFATPYDDMAPLEIVSV